MENIYNLMIRPHPIKTYLIWTKTYPFWKEGGRPKVLNIFCRPRAVINFSGPPCMGLSSCHPTLPCRWHLEPTMTRNYALHPSLEGRGRGCCRYKQGTVHCQLGHRLITGCQNFWSISNLPCATYPIGSWEQADTFQLAISWMWHQDQLCSKHNDHLQVKFWYLVHFMYIQGFRVYNNPCIHNGSFIALKYRPLLSVSKRRSVHNKEKFVQVISNSDTQHVQMRVRASAQSSTFFPSHFHYLLFPSGIISYKPTILSDDCLCPPLQVPTNDNLTNGYNMSKWSRDATG